MESCTRCQSANLVQNPRPDTIHGMELRCVDCDKFLKWISKGKDSIVQKKREPEHRDLLNKYSEGYCQSCLRLENELPSPQVLVAHHVIEYSLGGTSDRSNIWILCTQCHHTVHHLRTYLGHYAQQDLSGLIAGCNVELKRTGYCWRSTRILDFCEKACGKRSKEFLREPHFKVLLKRLQELPTAKISPSNEPDQEVV